MGLFNFFKKTVKINDDTFGEMVVHKSKDPSNIDYDGECLFLPLNLMIGIGLNADEQGPSTQQKEFYKEIQAKYDELREILRPVLNAELINWYNGKTIEDFDSELELESIMLPRFNGEDVEWSISYVVHKIDHWATVTLEGFEPKHLVIDG